MVRRRKTSSTKANGAKKPRVNKKDAGLKRWETREDIPLDDEEQFHADRDRILLEGDDEWDDDGLGDQNEVFGLKGLASSDDDEEEGESDSQWEHEEDEAAVKAIPSSKTSAELSRKAAPKAKDESEEEEDEGWGRKQSAYYVDGEGNASDEDEEELEKMEEEEARRLQRKAREQIAEEDYGLDFARNLDAEVEEYDVLKEVDPSPSTSAVPAKSKAVLLKELERSDPASLALARDWESVAEDVVRVEAALKSREPDDPALGLMNLHYQTLLTYATTLAFYLHMRASPTYATRPELLAAHPIMTRLLTLKTGVAELEGLGFSALEERDEDDSEEDESELDPGELDAMMARLGVDKNQVARMQQLGGGMSQREVIELLMDAAIAEGEFEEEQDVSPRPPRSKREEGGSSSKPVNGNSPHPTVNGKDKKKSAKPKPSSGRVEQPEPTYDLVEPVFESNAKKPKTKPPAPGPASTDNFDYSEPTALDEADAADKTARTKALQFHTSKIAKKSGKKQKERRAMGGDDDLPYADSRRKGKEVQKQSVEDAEASEQANQIPLIEGKKRVWGEPKAVNEEVEAWDGLETAGKGKKRVRETDADDEGDEPTTEYLELVKSTKKRKKEEKQAAYEAKEEERRLSNESDPALGPRMLSRDIIRNKGLTRQRGNPKNNVANPRVKKRQQYEKAKKKLASSKAVYKGGLNALGGQYEGELTGINPKLIKSVKFN
ncbi:hypothetical protein M407DRAFT_31668 [Tulasnella calospora MUT 4182]|uniref:Sas10 C-terminal domain-containing protein n=1 Tax=Tulasnella calospora MUT 4182 TaxID=1051891 RepID=A0A0C3KB61_9AGAM|nr:hypothetical protein M407DRAFT_31668 [Tulasnella calospora MUT 4182]